jgi:hypothetical protein
MAIKAIIATQFDATGIKKASAEFNKLGGTIKGALGAVGLGIGLAAITNGLKDSAKAAVEDVKSQALLAQQLRNQLKKDVEMTLPLGSLGWVNQRLSIK